MATGKCFCGNIEYKIQSDILTSGLCHCVDCQRLTGGTSLPFIMVPKDALEIKGDPK